MTTRLFTAKTWNDGSVLKHSTVRTLLEDWQKIRQGDDKAELRIVSSILKCKRDVCSVRVWLQHGFQPQRLEPEYETVKIYLNFFSKLQVKGNGALNYLNEERAKRNLSQFLDQAQSRVVLPPSRPALKLRFRKTATASTAKPRALVDGETTKRHLPSSSACPSVELGVTVPTGESASTLDTKSADITTTAEGIVVSAKIEPEDETLVSHNSEEHHEETPNLPKNGVPLEASREAETSVILGSKRKGLYVSYIRDRLPDPVGCLDQTPVDQITSDGVGWTTKRQKLDHSPIINCETHLLPSNSCSISNEVPCVPQERGKPIAKKPNKTQKPTMVKKAARCPRPKKVDLGTHLVQDDDSHLVIVKLEGRQQAQDSHPVNEGLELVTMEDGQLDSKPQESMAVPDGPRERSPCCMNGVSMEDATSSNIGLTSNFTDDTIQSPLKRELCQLPPIWAESRQEVCEAFDWFRSYQGGVYHADNAVKGYLLSAFASKRDVFENDGRVIISHGGGKSESIGSQKGLFVSHQASDQLADDKSVRALLDNYRSGRPLVLLVDDKYASFPYDLSSRRVTYAVLGFYSIVYAWAEFEPAKNKVGRVIRHKFAFRWCEEQGTPWWCVAENTGLISKDLPNNAGVPRIVSEVEFSRKSSLPILSAQMRDHCSVCGSFSHKVYSVWVCLATDCKMFWRNPKTKEFLPDSLEYDKQFFALSPRIPMPFGLNLVPETTVTRAMNGTSTSYAFTRGMHCPSCGRFSSRYQWEQLACRACKWTKKADIDIRSAKDFWGDRLPISFEYFQMSSVSDFIPEPIQSFKYEGGRGSIQTFTLPYNRGSIHHIRTPSATGMLEADKIFEHYQEEAKSGNLKFRRWPLKAHKCRGTLLTNYFSHNAGEPYQYVGSDANTVPFEQVPAVMEARQLIRDRVLQALDRTSEFNEVLSCAYMERQKMAFHSDAEVGLGPLVAGLSLGSPALMHFRIVARHDPLYERRGVLLTVVLRHGDILVMDGNGVQEYYEHTVVPNNFRIAATARQITPRHHRLDISLMSHPETVKDDDETLEYLHGIAVQS